jgi:hypothetical protein
MMSALINLTAVRPMELRYKKNKLRKERRPEGSAVISPCQAAVGPM